MDAVTALVMLISANTIFIIVALAIIFYVVTRMSMQMAQDSISPDVQINARRGY